MTAPALSTADAATEADRLWFAAHPRRRHRIRPYQPGEGPPSLPEPVAPPGWRVFVAVHQLRPGMRVRLTFIAQGDPATGEHAAARLFALALRDELPLPPLHRRPSP